MRMVVAAAAICFSIGGLSTAAEVAAAIRRPTNIPAQALRPALHMLSKERDFQLVFRTDLVGELHTSGAVGELTVSEALTQLLSGTGLTYRYLDDQTVTIVSAAMDSSSVLHAGEEGTNSDGRTKKGLWSRFGLAQAESIPGSKNSDTSKIGSEGRQEDQDEQISTQRSVQTIQEIVVTGSHIRGAKPAGSKVVVIDREEIYRSGYGTVQDVLAALPQNFKGTSDEFLGQSAGNTNRGAEIQLRGLGASTTLTLVNGRRQPAGGFSGAFTDVSSIPMSAVERVEILTDGASAIYGSDAIGGVVNIILRKDFQGAETRARFGTASGERDEVQFSQVFGTSWTEGNVLAGYQYSLQDALPAHARDYSASNGDLRDLGGSNFRQLLNRFQGNPGTILCPSGRTDCTAGQPAYAIPAGQDGTSLTTANLIPGAVNYTNTAAATELLPRQELHTAFINASYDLTDAWELFLEGRYGTRDMRFAGVPTTRTVPVPSSNPFYVNPFGGTLPVSVAYDFTKDLGPTTSFSTTDTNTVALGAIGQIPGQWQLKLDVSHARENSRFHGRNLINSAVLSAALADQNPTTALNVFGDGSHNNPATLDSIRSSTDFQGVSDNWYGGVLVDGPIAQLSGGAARLAIGLDYRDESYRRVRSTGDVTSNRNVSAAFGELALPIVGADNTRVGAHRLEMSIAARYEDYSDFGSTLNPKIGLAYQPVPALQLRGMWGTSFRAPSFYQSDEQVTAPRSDTRVVVDPQSATGSSTVIRLFGNNASLTEETATVWTAGFDLMPPAIKNLTASFTYYSIDYKDKIQAGDPSLELEDQWAPLITRNPSQAQIDAICNDPAFTGDCTGPLAAILDFRQRNIAAVRTSGLDFDLDHSLEAANGTWSYGLGGTYVFKHEQATTDLASAIDVLDTVANPLALRLRGKVSWSLRGWHVGAVINYFGSYEDIRTNPVTPVDSWTTVDLNFGFRTQKGQGWLDNTTLFVNAVNLFDEPPPFVNQIDPVGYDGANASILGRLVSVQLVRSW